MFQIRNYNNSVISIILFILINVNLLGVQAYSNFHTILNPFFVHNGTSGPCLKFFTPLAKTIHFTAVEPSDGDENTTTAKKMLLSPVDEVPAEKDPFDTLDNMIDEFLFGVNSIDGFLHVESFQNGQLLKISLDIEQDKISEQYIEHTNNNESYTTRRHEIYINGTSQVKVPKSLKLSNGTRVKYIVKNRMYRKLKPLKAVTKIENSITQYPTGAIMRAERYKNQVGVSMPNLEFMYRDRMKLNVTDDLMQTAVDAFFIIAYGSMKDIHNLPPDYILKSARAISMMRLSREKLEGMWQVVKGGNKTKDVTIETLELFRPLFKFVYPLEMAHLDLNNSRILTYIGTHADLDRHQVGVVASRYIKLNPNWRQPKYLNLMNNLLCGVPMPDMRKLDNSIYLQLNNQVFYHIHACEPIQRRLFYVKMLKSKALGKCYSWNANEVTKLGFLLTEVRGKFLVQINPESLSGLSARVVREMSPENLRYLTKLQRSYLNKKALNMLAKKLGQYNQIQAELKDSVYVVRNSIVLTIVNLLTVMLYSL